MTVKPSDLTTGVEEKSNRKVPMERKGRKSSLKHGLTQFLKHKVGEDEKTFIKSTQRKSMERSGLASSHTEQTLPGSG